MITQTVRVEIYSESDFKVGNSLIEQLRQNDSQDAIMKSKIEEHNSNIRKVVSLLFFSVIKKFSTEIDPALHKDSIVISERGGYLTCTLTRFRLGAMSSECPTYNLILPIKIEKVRLFNGEIVKFIVDNNISVLDVKLCKEVYLKKDKIMNVDDVEFIQDYTRHYYRNKI